MPTPPRPSLAPNTPASTNSLGIVDRARAKRRATSAHTAVDPSAPAHTLADPTGHSHYHPFPGWYVRDGMGKTHYPHAGTMAEAVIDYVGALLRDRPEWENMALLTLWQDAAPSDPAAHGVVPVNWHHVTVDLAAAAPACVHGHTHDWRISASPLAGTEPDVPRWITGAAETTEQCCARCGAYREFETICLARRLHVAVGYRPADAMSMERVLRAGLIRARNALPEADRPALEWAVESVLGFPATDNFAAARCGPGYAAASDLQGLLEALHHVAALYPAVHALATAGVICDVLNGAMLRPAMLVHTEQSAAELQVTVGQRFGVAELGGGFIALNTR